MVNSKNRIQELENHITKLEDSETKLKLTLDHYDLVRVKHEDEIDLLKARVKGLEEALRLISKVHNSKDVKKSIVSWEATAYQMYATAEQALNNK